jgi:hypothetical protein
VVRYNLALVYSLAFYALTPCVFVTFCAGTQFNNGVQQPTNNAETLTFKHIFGRNTLLTSPGDVPEHLSAGQYHDLTASSNAGTSVNTASVYGNTSYTNGKYTITDTRNLKQKTKKCSATTTGQGQQAQTIQCNQAYTGWSVKVVSMSASITSLKVIWKHVRALS